MFSVKSSILNRNSFFKGPTSNNQQEPSQSKAHPRTMFILWIQKEMKIHDNLQLRWECPMPSIHLGLKHFVQFLCECCLSRRKKKPLGHIIPPSHTTSYKDASPPGMIKTHLFVQFSSQFSVLSFPAFQPCHMILQLFIFQRYLVAVMIGNPFLCFFYLCLERVSSLLSRIQKVLLGLKINSKNRGWSFSIQ